MIILSGKNERKNKKSEKVQRNEKKRLSLCGFGSSALRARTDFVISFILTCETTEH